MKGKQDGGKDGGQDRHNEHQTAKTERHAQCERVEPERAVNRKERLMERQTGEPCVVKAASLGRRGQ